MHASLNDTKNYQSPSCQLIAARLQSNINLENEPVHSTIKNISDKRDLFEGTEFGIRVATDPTQRERAYALTQRIYQGRGYTRSKKTDPHRSGFAPHPDTLTLMVEDSQGRAWATVSLVFDSRAGLPCEELYTLELTQRREEGRKLVEVTRLAIDQNGTDRLQRKMILVKLFNFIYVFARRVRGFDEFLIEVNPRHAGFYHRLLGFEVRGPERPCERVNGAPAVLLSLDLNWPAREIRRMAGLGEAAGSRTLYPWFVTECEEAAIVDFLTS